MSAFLSRRSFSLGLAAMAAAPHMAQAHNYDPSDVPPPTLETLKWAQKTRASLQALMVAHGQYSAHYDHKKRPYIVFDWDETAIVGNVQLTLFHYMLEHFAFLLPAHEFQKLLHSHGAEKLLPLPFTTQDGKRLSLHTLVQDILEDYRALAARYGHRPHPLPRDELQQDPTVLAFKARMAFYHHALTALHGGEIAQRWLVSLAAGHTLTDVVAMSRAANEWYLGQAIGTIKWACPPERAGVGGPVSTTITQALRLTPEISDLFQIMQEHGIDPVICTASLEECTAIFATSTEYGYNIPREHIFGARLEEHHKTLLPLEAANVPFPYEQGKTALIKKYMVSKREGPPLAIIAGEDSTADLIKTFANTPLCCLINRKQSDAMMPFLKEAAEMRTLDTPRLVLQGRDENTGEWLPTEASIFLGDTMAQLP
ncbi:MAG: lipoprotein pyruvate-formate lyase [Acetobacter orientalis]|uniref:lipoprotein pyruvate-formate lyase n=1 Tax=Acetobacter orientalis TaxID=146474 RepID=UPI0039E9B678